MESIRRKNRSKAIGIYEIIMYEHRRDRLLAEDFSLHYTTIRKYIEVVHVEFSQNYKGKEKKDFDFFMPRRMGSWAIKNGYERLRKYDVNLLNDARYSFDIFINSVGRS